MSSASALACLKDRGYSDQYQDDASPEQVVATVVLIGVVHIAEEGDRPACPVDMGLLYRQGPRVSDRVRIVLGVEQELPVGALGMRTMRCTICSEGLYGSLKTITSRTWRLSTGTRWLMTTPPTESPGRMLPERTGVTIQVPWTWVTTLEVLAAKAQVGLDAPW
jgi:hypothetical protein